VVWCRPAALSAREIYIRRTILPALGSTELRKLRGPVLDTFYARLRGCSNRTRAHAADRVERRGHGGTLMATKCCSQRGSSARVSPRMSRSTTVRA
jgi:hypothetical protein